MRLLDRQCDWIARVLTPENQRRTGLLMIYLGVLFLFYMPFSGEAPGIYLMSALAVMLTGVTGVIAAVPTEATNNEGES